MGRLRTFVPTAGLLALVLISAPAGAHVPARSSQAASDPALLPQAVLPMPSRMSAEAPMVPTPRAKCTGAGDIPEPGMQGRLAAEDIASGKAEDGYLCNLDRIGTYGRTGGFKVYRYVDRNGHECAYYDTALLFPTNTLNLSGELTGVAVLDMSNPQKPVRTDTLLTPAMQSPHESVNISVQRGILAAVAGNPAFAPGIVDVYDISQDCRRPVLQASAPVGFLGHESGMAPDGRTFYATSTGTGHTTAVDISNPKVPITLLTANYGSHGMTISDDGNRGYMTLSDGISIVDLSDIQSRKPNPQIREISRLTWPNVTIPQIAHPVTIKGKPYLIEIDEYSNTESGSFTAHGPRVGAARIIDISDETKPRVVSNIRLEVHQPENRAALADDPGAQNPTQGYAGHYCGIPQRKDPEIIACSMIISGLRVFDIRDPEKPKEVAYHVAPPSTVSETGGPVVDERSNWAMSQPAFNIERREVWYSDGQSGFYTLRLDEKAWPQTGSDAGCEGTPGLSGVGARSMSRGAVQLQFKRETDLPVRVDVFRVSKGRDVIKERLVKRFAGERGTFTWSPGREVGKGTYFVRFRMLKDGEAFDTRRVVLERSSSGAWSVKPSHYRRDSCGLIGKFKLERPVFGGEDRAPLSGAYRLEDDARVTITVTQGKKVVKRFAAADKPGGVTHRFTIPSAGLARGVYTVRLTAVAGDDQISATVGAKKL